MTIDSLGLGLLDESWQVAFPRKLRDPVEHARGAQQHGHLVPAARQTVTKCVRGAIGIRTESIGYYEQNTRCTEGQEGLTTRQNAQTQYTGRFTTATACNHGGGQLQLARGSRRKCSGGARPLDE